MACSKYIILELHATLLHYTLDSMQTISVYSSSMTNSIDASQQQTRILHEYETKMDFLYSDIHVAYQVEVACKDIIPL